jgi:hypothetical protein
MAVYDVIGNVYLFSLLFETSAFQSPYPFPLLSYRISLHLCIVLLLLLHPLLFVLLIFLRVLVFLTFLHIPHLHLIDAENVQMSKALCFAHSLFLQEQ